MKRKGTDLPMSDTSLIQEIIAVKNELPKKQRVLCDFILKNYHSLGLKTVKELSQEARVGISTVMRTINALGYHNFNDFRKDMYEESLTEKTNSQWALKESLSTVPTNDNEEHTLVQVWKESVNLLDGSLEDHLLDQFDEAIELLIQANSINVFGTRPYKAVALYFEQLIGEFYPRVRQLSHDSEVVFDKVLQMEEEEVFLIFAFEPYTNRVIQATKIAHELGVKIILVTDHISCPIIEYASVTLRLEVSKERFSIVPTVAIMEAMVIEFGKRSSEKSIKKLSRLEETLKAQDVTYYIK